MSRICVKNVNKTASESQLREMFSSKGEVTDVKLLKTKDGKPRKIAFIGFRTELQAQEAQKYFNNTFMGLSKLSVEIAKRVNDQSLLEAKLKHQKKSKGGKAANSTDVQEEVVYAKGKDPKAETKEPVMSKNKADFMEMMKNRREAKFWANDDVVGNDQAVQEPASNSVPFVEKKSGAKLAREESDSDASDSGADSDDDDDDDSVNDFMSNKGSSSSKATTANGKDKSAQPAGMSDLDYLKSKAVSHFSDSDESDGEGEGEGGSEGESDGDEEEKEGSNKKTRSSNSSSGARLAVEQSDSDGDDSNANKKSSKSNKNNTGSTSTSKEGRSNSIDNDDDLEDSPRLFVKNLPFTCTEEEFSTLFSSFGAISEVHLPIDKERKGKGFGFIQFMIPEHATAAMNELSGSSFQGRLLHITKAHKKIDYSANATVVNADGTVTTTAPKGNPRLSSFQQKKEEERRKFANRQEGWNAAFVRSDAVVESLADKYGISRSDILDTSEGGGELAVRLAIGETQVINENREYFLAHGVDISALESVHSDSKASKRSTTTLLVKNLPYDLVEDEVESMFARFGAISAFLVPKSRTIALVDFVEPTEARAAYKGLAYRSYKHMPMYLEWAPVNTIDKQKAAAAAKALKAKQEEIATNKGGKSKRDGDGDDKSNDSKSNGGEAEDNMDEYSTLFIKNLNFSTTETNLKDHFAHLHIDGLRTISIQKKQVGNNILSQGYGFAEFASHKQAQEAMVKLNGSLIDSHALVVKPSDKRLTIKPVTLKSNNNSNNSNSNSANPSAIGVNNAHGNNNKLIVRNVAFQATKHEIRSLFSAFGSIKRVRIPKKMGGDHRGFAFIDFNTAQEAATAMASLKDTHLYGRHLVLEWAKEEDEDDGNGGPMDVIKNIDALRKRARADEQVIRTENKRARAKETIDDAALGGGVGSDDI